MRCSGRRVAADPGPQTALTRDTPLRNEMRTTAIMKTYVSFDYYYRDQKPNNRAIIRALRKFVGATAPQLKESVKWGNGCWLAGTEPVAYVYSDTGLVQFGFFSGSSLKDPRGLLEGTGRYVRHIKVHAPSDVDPPAFGALLRQAARLSRPSNRLPVNKRSVTALSKRAAGARPPQRGR